MREQTYTYEGITVKIVEPDGDEKERFERRKKAVQLLFKSIERRKNLKS